MIKIHVQFFNYPVYSYTVKKLNERKGEHHKSWTSAQTPYAAP